LKAGFIYGLVLGGVIGIFQSGLLDALDNTVTFLMIILVVGIVSGISAFMGHFLKRYSGG
jgi:flagellar biosynthesis protein FliQ